ncbi:MAG TPA: hypothetical protein VHA33_13970 [Candidatus Angelobacter sp.]|nr:hypothetical protein [Candidatus Angelobacter sp.]
MSLRVFFAAFFLTSLVVVAQTGTPIVVSPAPGVVSNGGYVVAPGNGQVAASTVAFASPPTTAGISVAGFAGISDHAPAPQGIQSTLGPSTLVVSSMAPNIVYTPVPAVNATATPEAATTTTTSGDLSPSVFAGNNISGPPPSTNASRSLGDVAEQYKAQKGAQQARTYTNADVQNLLGRRGGGNIMEAADRAPSGVMASTQSPAPSSSQSASQPSPPQTTPTAPVGSSASPNQDQQNAGTTPQIRQSQPAETQENTQQLPATATILPLLGLIGLASSGVGLWVRRGRR